MVDGACCVFLFVVLSFFSHISRESSFPPAPGGGDRRVSICISLRAERASSLSARRHVWRVRLSV